MYDTTAVQLLTVVVQMTNALPFYGLCKIYNNINALQLLHGFICITVFFNGLLQWFVAKIGQYAQEFTAIKVNLPPRSIRRLFGKQGLTSCKKATKFFYTP